MQPIETGQLETLSLHTNKSHRQIQHEQTLESTDVEQECDTKDELLLTGEYERVWGRKPSW